MTYPNLSSDCLIQGLDPNYGYFKKYSELELSESDKSELMLLYENQRSPNPEQVS